MKKWKKALSLLLVSCILLTGFICNCFAADRPSTYELSSVFTVTVDGIDDTYFTIRGSSLVFAVGKQGEPVSYLATDVQAVTLTSALTHISEQLIKLLADEGLIVDAAELESLISLETSEFCIAHNENWIPVDLSFASPNGIVILEIPEESEYITDAVTAVFSTGAKSGDAVANFTLSATTDELYSIVAGDTDLQTHAITAQNGTLTHTAILSDENNAAVLMADMIRSLGALGSPLLNSKNEVIGVTSYDADKDVTLAMVSDDAAKQLYSMEIIASDIPDAGSSAGSSDSSGIVGETDSEVAKLATIIKYAIIAAIALVVILIVLLIIRFRSGKDAEEEMNENDMEEQYEQRQRELRKKHQQRHPQAVQEENKEAAQAAAPPPIRPVVRPTRPAVSEQEPVPAEQTQPAAAAATATATVETNPEYVTMTVVTGKKKGFSLKVSERVVIGRDPSTCKMLFPASDTTISRTHCALTYIPSTGDIVLEDLTSSNGTYSASGRRLIPGKKYRVRIGDRFYLGTEENMIEVR